MNELTLEFIYREIRDLTDIDLGHSFDGLNEEGIDNLSSILAAIYNISNKSNEPKWNSDRLCELIEDAEVLGKDNNLTQLSDFAVGEWQKLELACE